MSTSESPELFPTIGGLGEDADKRAGQMGDLHTIDHFGIGRSMLLKAVRARAAVGDEEAAIDIAEALTEVEQMTATSDWWGLVSVACWLAMRAEEVVPKA
jgi:hypothetical protein